MYFRQALAFSLSQLDLDDEGDLFLTVRWHPAPSAMLHASGHRLENLFYASGDHTAADSDELGLIKTVRYGGP